MTNFWDKLKSKGPIIALAPMAGVTDSAFRQMCKEYGADLVYTEMVSADGMFYDSEKTLNLTNYKEMERPIIVQMMGHDPLRFAESAKKLEAMGVDGIDINFGCPAKKVVKNLCGAQLMEDLDQAHKIIKATTEAVKIPISCKIRKSKFNKVTGKDVTALEFIEKMSDLDLKAIMLHGRRYEQVHAGEVDYELIRQAKEKFNGILLANGSIDSPEKAAEVLRLTGADGVGIARAAHGRPYIFKQIKKYLETGELWEPNMEEIRQIALRHVELSYENKEGRGLIEMRKHLGWYIRGMIGASDLRSKLVQASDLNEIRELLVGA
jgi:nifR3 family TIM-barrel protein